MNEELRFKAPKPKKKCPDLDKELNTEINFVTPTAESYDSDMPDEITDSDWQRIEDLRKEEKQEDVWIKHIKEYCQQSGVLPIDLIELHKKQKASG